MNAKQIKELNRKSAAKVGCHQYCHKCGEFCPGGLIENKWCDDCQPHCRWCEARGNDDAKANLVMGHIWSDYHRKKIIFRGYLCEQHADVLDGLCYL